MVEKRAQRKEARAVALAEEEERRGTRSEGVQVRESMAETGDANTEDG